MSVVGIIVAIEYWIDLGIVGLSDLVCWWGSG